MAQLPKIVLLPDSSEMPVKLYKKFDGKTIPDAWNVFAKEALAPFLRQNLCPVPSLELANMFDVSTVFNVQSGGKKIERTDLFASKTTFQYMDNLSNVFIFSTRNEAERAKMFTLDYDEDYPGTHEYFVEGGSAKRSSTKSFYLRLDNIMGLKTHLALSQRDHFVIDTYIAEEMDKCKQQLIVTDVIAAEKVRVIMVNGTDKDEFVVDAGPVPLAFGTMLTTVKSKSTMITDIERVPRREVKQHERWATAGPVPRQCKIAQMLFDRARNVEPEAVPSPPESDSLDEEGHDEDWPILPPIPDDHVDDDDDDDEEPQGLIF